MRDATIQTALAKTEWQTWKKEPIAGDASARRYFRLSQPGKGSVILMDDPALATVQFAMISETLTVAGLAAPKIFHHDHSVGIMVIEDLGSTDFARHIAQVPSDEIVLYRAANEILITLHDLKPTLTLGTITPNVAAEMIELAAKHYAPTRDGQEILYTTMLRVYADIVDPAPHLALRDFHAENLIWRPEMSSVDNVGLLDFQDAIFAPAGYDLMSLLRDARRDVSPVVAKEIVVTFCQKIGRGYPDMSAHLACVSAQRNLRILGIFARLAKQDGKVKYLSLLPRVWGHLMTDLAHPALADLRKVVLAELPEPTTETLQRLGAK